MSVPAFADWQTPFSGLHVGRNHRRISFRDYRHGAGERRHVDPAVQASCVRSGARGPASADRRDEVAFAGISNGCITRRLGAMRELARYWQTDYEWRVRGEAERLCPNS